MTTGHDIMVKLSGVPTGQMPVILAERIARAVALHYEAHQSFPEGLCWECCEAWPCATYKILTGQEAG